MKNLKKALAILLALALAFSMVCMVTACGEPAAPADNGDATDEGDATDPALEQTYELRCSTLVAAEHTLTLSAQRFADAVNEATDGHVVITVYPASQLGDYINVYGELMLGSIDFMWGTIPDTYNKLNNLAMTPYIAYDYDDIRALYCDHDSWFFSTLEQVNADKGVKLLGLVPNGFMGVGAKKVGDTSTLFDFTKSQDALIRSAAIDSLVAQTETFGYRVTTIAYSELYSALQTGIADGWYGGSAISNNVGFKDVIEYFVDYRGVNEAMGMFMSQATFDKLPAAYQDAIVECALQENNDVIDLVAEAEEKAKEELEAYGIEIITPTAEEFSAMAKIMREKVYPQFEDLYGAELMDTIYAWVDEIDK